MPLLFVRQDITKMHVDAIVNAANESLLGGGGVDGAIHRAAGPELLRECSTLGGCKTGEAKRTQAYQLPCRYVIHTVGPVWFGGDAGEQELLSACYANSLQIAADSGCESVAFPLISAGVYGYPKAEAIRVAVENIRAFLQTHDMTVYLVLFDREAVDAAKARFEDLRQYIDDAGVNRIEQRFARGADYDPRSGFEDFLKYSDEPGARGKGQISFTGRRFERPDEGVGNAPDDAVYAAQEDALEAPEMFYSVPAHSPNDPSLDEMLRQLDESFSEMLLRKIDEKNMTDAQCYKKANIDRKLFSKIRSNPYYKPSKSTVLAFAIALELPLPEVREMLGKAGYALSRSNKFDVIVEYFINKGTYDVFEINEALFAFDQNLLGA